MKVYRFGEILKEEKEIKNMSFIDNIINIFEESIGSKESTLVKKSISSYISDEDSIAIKGLVNDSDIYDFFIKYTNDIDNTLRDINHYEKTPAELNSNGLYDYVIISTKIAIKEELINYLKNKKGE